MRALFLLTCSLLLAACQQPQPTQSVAVTTDLPDLAKTLTMAQNGQSVTLKVGEAMELALPAEPSTGYRWEVVRAPGKLLKTSAQKMEPDPHSRACQMERMQFAANEQGRGMLTLAYRPVDNHADVANYYTLYLRVEPRR